MSSQDATRRLMGEKFTVERVHPCAIWQRIANKRSRRRENKTSFSKQV
jgi:hypothetical protein